jgi:phosphoribosylformylglycinamidine cyclo-ligase
VSDEPLTYASAGVSLEAGDEVVERIKEAVASTRVKGVVGGVGGFSGLFTPSLGDPLLAAGCDGVGTKIMLGKQAGRFHGLGVDLVAMCANDVLTSGVRPLFFMDVITCGKVVPERVAELVEGVADGCRQAGCALLGGETAEHPDMMAEDDFDMAGFCVGGAERREMISGARATAGDVVVALASSGPHSNGFSLIRRILQRSGADLGSAFAGSTLGDVLIAPTRIYVKPVLALMRDVPVKGMAHITGGGIVENVPRMLPQGLQARMSRAAWPQPAIFAWLAQGGNVDVAEMHRVFNCGIGMVLVVADEHADRAVRLLEAAGERAFRIGSIVAQPSGEHAAVVL